MGMEILKAKPTVVIVCLLYFFNIPPSDWVPWVYTRASAPATNVTKILCGLLLAPGAGGVWGGGRTPRLTSEHVFDDIPPYPSWVSVFKCA